MIDAKIERVEPQTRALPYPRIVTKGDLCEWRSDCRCFSGKDERIDPRKVGDVWPDCPCVAQKRWLEFVKLTGVPVEHIRVGGLFGYDRTRNTEAFDRVLRWISNPNRSLFLGGTVGTGKTLLASGAIMALCFGRQCRFISTTNYMALATNFEDGLRHPKLATLRNCRVLCFDDFGAERKTEFAAEKIFEVIDHRYNAQLPTIFTSNHSPKEMLRDLQYMRIMDRIRQNCEFVELTGMSYRSGK